MLQAYKLPKNSTDYEVYRSDINFDRTLNFKVKGENRFKKIVTNRKYETCKIAGFVINGELVSFDSYEIEDFHQDCINAKVTSPVLIIIRLE